MLPGIHFYRPLKQSTTEVKVVSGTVITSNVFCSMLENIFIYIFDGDILEVCRFALERLNLHMTLN